MAHVMIVVSPYYQEISSHLLNGAKAALDEVRSTYEVVEVPGALEIPMALKLGQSRKETRDSDHRKFDAYVALGCVIRGETSHYDIVCNESASGLMQLALEYNMPIGNGILTCDTKDQALVRADVSQKNKGADAACAALHLFDLKRSYRVI
ncbi:MAG: 6,7-dimethyl-8-ribityllumazine synthase [Alphaproteobacteria bacterium]